jgi:hypothetical protein
MGVHEQLSITTAEFDIIIDFIEQACIEMKVPPPLA